MALNAQTYTSDIDAVATAAAKEELGSIRSVQTTEGEKLYKYVKATGTIAAVKVVASDVSEGDNYSVEVGGANNYGQGVSVVAMDTTTPYAWVQVGGLITGLASLTAGERVAASTTGAVTSNAAPSANDLGTATAVTTTSAVLKGLI